MPLPETDYFSLEEIAERWRVPVIQVQRYGETGIIDVCVRLRSAEAEGGTYEIDKTGLAPQIFSFDLFHNQKATFSLALSKYSVITFSLF